MGFSHHDVQKHPSKNYLKLCSPLLFMVLGPLLGYEKLLYSERILTESIKYSIKTSADKIKSGFYKVKSGIKSGIHHIDRGSLRYLAFPGLAILGSAIFLRPYVSEAISTTMWTGGIIMYTFGITSYFYKRDEMRAAIKKEVQLNGEFSSNEHSN